MSADQAEVDALKVYAETCASFVVHYTPAARSVVDEVLCRAYGGVVHGLLFGGVADSGGMGGSAPAR
ncbi:hypothetical protein [Streptomyces sp. NPDC048350]|uniref:hypothetical protein n=1 Tax=Streptomyces sp. NPDC048350 TaxID=3365538 RepID=UPI00371FC535